MNITQDELTFVKLKYGIPDRFCYDAVEFSNHIQRLVPEEFLLEFGYAMPAHRASPFITLLGSNAHNSYPYNSKQYTDQLLIDLVKYEQRREANH